METKPVVSVDLQKKFSFVLLLQVINTTKYLQYLSFLRDIYFVKNGISQRFKDRGSKQDDYISQFMFQIIYIHIQVSESCV